MRGKTVVIFWLVLTLIFSASQVFADEPQTSDFIELLRYENQFSSVRIEPARMDQKQGIAVIFEGTDDLHYYANPETAPAPGLDLKISAESDDLVFGQTIFPQFSYFLDPFGTNVQVYVGIFTVFIPIKAGETLTGTDDVDVDVKITGIACTSKICLRPFEKTLKTTIELSGINSWKQIFIETPQALQGEGPTQASHRVQEVRRQAILPYNTAVYYLLAIVAGISINIMPCVLPVIPLIMMRLIGQAKQSSSKRISSGMAFCGGVVLFFAAFALLAVIINLSTGAVIDLNSLFRYPVLVIFLFLAIVFFGLVMLDIVTLALPSSVTNKQSSTSGIAGSAGMGFFTGILSTPCSGALLGFVLVWAQTQTLFVSSIAIVLMGVGMALPYALIVLIPSLLERIPKPGNWMEFFKKSMGFLLFFIAVKLTLTALPKERLVNVLIYGIVFSFCVWMWGRWVSFSTPAAKKWTVRLTALIIAFAAGIWMLPAPVEADIDWQKYDANLVSQATLNKQPVLLKFTADWCTNCKVVDKKVYHDPKVVEYIKEKNVLAIKADTTVINYPATVDLKKVYGEAGNVPVTILLLPNGGKEKFRGIFDREHLIEILKELPDSRK
ncbi:protein-disulfide reductase DsbD family protein [Planctomycetota bacterium]